jgi:C4-type Zn-finger protein
MPEVKCPECKKSAQCYAVTSVSCFYSATTIYTLVCSSCSYKEEQTLDAGICIDGYDEIETTYCPFCGKPDDEHKKAPDN